MAPGRPTRWPLFALALAALAPAAAPAADVVVHGRVRAGGLHVSALPDRVRIPALAPTRAGWRTATVHLPVRITDARGTGAGWRLALSLSARTAAGRRVSGLRTSVWGVRARCAACTRASSRVVLPVAVFADHGVPVFTAVRGSGMGRIDYVADVVVTVPAAAPRGAYVLRPALSRISGP